MSSFAGALAGAPLRFDHGGKTYEASYLTQGVKASFEQWIVSRALGMLSQLRAAMAAEEYAEEKAKLLDQVAAGKFGFHGRVSRAAMKTPDGNLAISRLLFGCTEDEMVRLVSERGDDVAAVLELVVQESTPRGAQKKKPGAEGDAARAEEEAEEEPFDVNALVASLAGPPLRLRFADIAALTDRQIVDVYGHERDDQGRVRCAANTPGVGNLTPEQDRALGMALAASLGLPPENIKHRTPPHVEGDRGDAGGDEEGLGGGV
ncbi:MAG: hypothetical protein LC745_01480 [Planctomycetia bacterium]|nr:hypothetical protein [Planctomycetia bacterium]